MRCFAWTVASFSLMTIILFSFGPVRIQGAERKCSADKDCTTIVNGTSTCVEGSCECLDNTTVMVIDSNKWYCVETFNEAGNGCIYNQQCHYPGGVCSTNSTCACDIRKYTQQDNKCLIKEKNYIIPLVVGASIGAAIIATLILYVWLSRRKK